MIYNILRESFDHINLCFFQHILLKGRICLFVADNVIYFDIALLKCSNFGLNRGHGQAVTATAFASKEVYCKYISYTILNKNECVLIYNILLIILCVCTCSKTYKQNMISTVTSDLL